MASCVLRFGSAIINTTSIKQQENIPKSLFYLVVTGYPTEVLCEGGNLYVHKIHASNPQYSRSLYFSSYVEDKRLDSEL